MESNSTRTAGVLCHISSLPNKYGIGSLGKEAYRFADFLKKAHVGVWQILPLVQTGFGDSPYQSSCCNSGNPYFIDLEALRDEGLLDDEELSSCEMPAGNVDYATLYEKRFNILRLAYARFNIRNPEFVEFVNSGVFDDYALFMSLKSRYDCPFVYFPDAYKYKENLAMNELKHDVFRSDYCFWLFLQFTFIKQWKKLKAYVNSLGIKIIGDLPLYVAYDSADVWARPELFRLDVELRPTKVAGVPPDYFSKKGQLWGNPLYNWDVLEADGYDWWINRVKMAREYYDIIRIDHFRGLDRYYAIPADSATAEIGEWEDGPKEKLFAAIKEKLGDVDIIAEDLGVLDEGVERLIKNTGFAGMKILQFAFDGKESNPYLPANIGKNSVVYTGTHDNSTSLGFLNAMSEYKFREFKTRLRAALSGEGVVQPFTTRKQTVYALVRCALATDADLAVIPVQDLLTLDDSARMNIPATPQGNWRFRLEKMPDNYAAAVMRNFVKATSRDPAAGVYLKDQVRF